MRERFLAIALTCLLAMSKAIAAEAERTLRILAADRPQAIAEQRLADKTFTPKTGVKVIIETNSVSSREQKLSQLIAAKSGDYDLVHYENHWLGTLVAAGALTRLDGVEYLGTNEPIYIANHSWEKPDALIVSTNEALEFTIFRPEIACRVSMFPMIEKDLRDGNYERYQQTPIFGLPWSVSALVLMYRTDLVEGAFGRVQPAVAKFYQQDVQPNWKDRWRFFVNAAGLVQIVQPTVKRAVFTRASTTDDAILEDFLPILWSFGGELWDERTGRVEGVLNSASNIKALDFYSEWNGAKKIVSPEAAHWGNADVLKAFAGGEAVMGPIWPHLTPPLEEQPRIAGRISYAPLPGVTAVRVRSKASEKKEQAAKGALNAFEAETYVRRATLYGCQGVGINAHSQHKKEAWQYLQWLYSHETQLALIFEKGSVYISPRRDLGAESGAPHARNKAVLEQYAMGIARARWNLPGAAKLDSILALECNLAFHGMKSAKEALDSAAKELQAQIDAAKR